MPTESMGSVFKKTCRHPWALMGLALCAACVAWTVKLKTALPQGEHPDRSTQPIMQWKKVDAMATMDVEEQLKENNTVFSGVNWERMAMNSQFIRFLVKDNPSRGPQNQTQGQKRTTKEGDDKVKARADSPSETNLKVEDDLEEKHQSSEMEPVFLEAADSSAMSSWLATALHMGGLTTVIILGAAGGVILLIGIYCAWNKLFDTSATDEVQDKPTESKTREKLDKFSQKYSPKG